MKPHPPPPPTDIIWVHLWKSLLKGKQWHWCTLRVKAPVKEGNPSLLRHWMKFTLFTPGWLLYMKAAQYLVLNKYLTVYIWVIILAYFHLNVSTTSSQYFLALMICSIQTSPWQFPQEVAFELMQTKWIHLIPTDEKDIEENLCLYKV